MTKREFISRIKKLAFDAQRYEIAGNIRKKERTYLESIDLNVPISDRFFSEFESDITDLNNYYEVNAEDRLILKKFIREVKIDIINRENKSVSL